MDNAFHLTGYDFLIAALLLLFVLRGLWVGFLRQIAVLVALLAAFLITGQYHDKLFPFLRELTENPHTIFWSSYVILFVLTYVLTFLLGKGLAKVVELTVAGWFDKLLGGVLGVVKGVVLVVLLNMVLTGVIAPENSMLRDCSLCPYVKQATEIFRGLIKDDAVRQAFSQKEPAISEKEVEPSADSEKEAEPSADGVRPFVPTEFPEDAPAPAPVE